MKRKLREELIKLSTDIITSREDKELTELYDIAKELYEKLAVLKFIDEKLKATGSRIMISVALDKTTSLLSPQFSILMNSIPYFCKKN